MTPINWWAFSLESPVPSEVVIVSSAKIRAYSAVYWLYYTGTGDLRMYYHSFDVEKGHFAVGIARSKDGIKRVKLGKIMGGGKTGSSDEFGALGWLAVAPEMVFRNREASK
ncbi:Glycosyl hydrolase, five-bladed beta-propellor domain-containing protein [Quillaja saponaria]|uniref:Glycosyl hydrolase, five-bladed beta-propellor domain-containing protein n=1 Tax=Quillaja saponaria TaxID=32244 RepID=A0AAD7KP36_QUISA|nr:Glycosyl hydrolase, five-bladed beta-propellor domain-containing protein [Quillaja saponaria]